MTDLIAHCLDNYINKVTNIVHQMDYALLLEEFGVEKQKIKIKIIPLGQVKYEERSQKDILKNWKLIEG